MEWDNEIRQGRCISGWLFFSKILLMHFSGGGHGRALKSKDLKALLCFGAGNDHFRQTLWDFTTGLTYNGLITMQKDLKLHPSGSFKAL